MGFSGGVALAKGKVSGIIAMIYSYSGEGMGRLGGLVWILSWSVNSVVPKVAVMSAICGNSGC